MYFRRFLTFIINPQYNKAEEIGIKQSIAVILYSLLWYYSLAIIASILFALPLMYFGLWPKPPHFGSATFFDMVLLAPFIEELAFRLPMRCFYWNVFISFGLIFYAFTHKEIGNYLSGAVAITLIGLPYIINKLNNIEIRINNIFEKYFKYFFYFSVILFAALHLTNLEDLKFKNYLVSPFIVSFQIGLGLILGYLRVNYRFGIMISILSHMLINFFIALPMLF